MADPRSVWIFSAFNPDDTLTHDHEMLDHPIDRTAIKNLAGAPRSVPCSVPQPAVLGQALRLPDGERLDRCGSDRELKEMYGHGAEQTSTSSV